MLARVTVTAQVVRRRPQQRAGTDDLELVGLVELVHRRPVKRRVDRPSPTSLAQR